MHQEPSFIWGYEGRYDAWAQTLIDELILKEVLHLFEELYMFSRPHVIVGKVG